MTESDKPSEPDRRRRQPAAGLMDPHGEIAARLRALYAEVEREPIPSELIELLERLDQAEENASHDR